jgi:ATP-dependent RNA helicase DHX8/PRP22
MTTPERWEHEQMLKSGVISFTDLPNYDEESGGLNNIEVEQGINICSSQYTIQIHQNRLKHNLTQKFSTEVEIELVDEEPLFLQGQMIAAGNLSPVKIVKNPEGSLARAAMTQSQLAKERRELREQQRSEQYLSAPKGMF